MQLYVLVIEGRPGKLVAVCPPVQLFVLLGVAGPPWKFVILVVPLIVGLPGQLDVSVVEGPPGSMATDSARRPRVRGRAFYLFHSSSSFSARSAEQISDRVGVLGVMEGVRRPRG